MAPREPTTWRDVDARDVGARARALADRRRRRDATRGASSSAPDARRASDSSRVEDALGFEGVDAVALVERARATAGEDVDAWDEKRARRATLARMTTTEEGFDARAYLVAAHGERTREELARGATRLEAEIDAVRASTRMSAAEELPTVLACLDAMEDARGVLRRGREEAGEFGATAELEARLSRAWKSARESLREVFAIEERREKIARALEAMERHEDVFGIPGAVREALSRGEYARAAETYRRARAAFSGKRSRVLDAVLDEVEENVKSAEERMYERLYVGDLDDAHAERIVTALQTLKLCRPALTSSQGEVTAAGNAVHIYLDRLVEYACEELTNTASSDDFDVETLSRGYRALFVRVWRFVTLMDTCASSYARDASTKIQSVYVGFMKSRFDNSLNKRTIETDAEQANRRFDVLIDKCAKMSCIGFSLSYSYDILGTRLSLQPDLLEALQQQYTRFSVSLRVHLEQALKLAAQPLAQDQRLETTTQSFFRDARVVFQITAEYWLDERFTPWMINAGSRDVGSLIDTFYDAARSLVALARELRRGPLASLAALKQIENGCAVFFDEFNFTGTGIGNEANRVAFRDDISRTTQMFLDEFVGGEMSAIIVAVRRWFAAPVEKTLESRPECVDVLHRVRSTYESATSTVPELATAISQDIAARLVDALRSEFTSNLSQLRPTASTLRVEFELLKLALDARSTKQARDGASRLVDLAARVAPDDDAIARARAIANDAQKHKHLLVALGRLA
jgi:exocyst complex component 2